MQIHRISRLHQQGLQQQGLLRNRLLGGVFLPLVLLTATIVPPPTPIQFGAGEINWPTNWVALTELNDPADDVSPIRLENDFVGDAISPAAFYAVDERYVFFRIRVRAWTEDFSAVPSPLFAGDTFWIFVNPYDDLNPRYAFAWDTKGQPYYKHGLEMMVQGKDESLTHWNQVRMQDRDVNEDDKIAPPDFKWKSADGFIRLVSLQPTFAYGNTTFIDWAISKQYLAANVPELLVQHRWQVNFASRTNGFDHDNPNADVAGGALSGDHFRYSRWIDVNVTAP